MVVGAGEAGCAEKQEGYNGLPYLSHTVDTCGLCSTEAVWNSVWGMDSTWLLWSETELQSQLCKFPAAQPWAVAL